MPMVLDAFRDNTAVTLMLMLMSIHKLNSNYTAQLHPDRQLKSLILLSRMAGRLLDPATLLGRDIDLSLFLPVP